MKVSEEGEFIWELEEKARIMTSFVVDTSFVDAAACGDIDGVKEVRWVVKESPQSHETNLLPPLYLKYLATLTFPAANINLVDKDGRSAFHYACLNDDETLLTLLLSDKRVDVSLITPNQDTCFHLAALYSSLQVLAILKDDYRAKKLIDAQNKFGETALHLCAGSGDKNASKTASFLLSAGASLTMPDKWKRSPVDCSRDNGYNGTLKVLTDFLAENPSVKAETEAMTAAYLADKAKPVANEEVRARCRCCQFLRYFLCHEQPLFCDSLRLL